MGPGMFRRVEQRPRKFRLGCGHKSAGTISHAAAAHDQIHARNAASAVPPLRGLVVRHAPIDSLITAFKVALLIGGTRPRRVVGNARPNPGDFFYASLLVL